MNNNVVLATIRAGGVAAELADVPALAQQITGLGGSPSAIRSVNGQIVAEGKVPVSAPLAFSANDCFELGSDLGSPASLDYFHQRRSSSMGPSAQR